MKEKNIKIKDEYLDFLEISDKTKRTKQHIDEVLTAYIKHLNNKNFNDVKENDVIKFLKKYSEQTYNPRLSILRCFYRWYLKLGKRELPDYFKRLELKSIVKIRRRNKMKYMEKLVTDEEYQTLVDNCTKYQHRAIIETLKLFGIRNSELISMKIKGVEYTEKGRTRIHVYDSKSKPRPIVYDDRADYLLTWINNYHPNKDDKESFVFTSNGGRPYTKTGIDEVLKRTSNRAGLRKILPHDFRHTSITNARKNGIPDTHIENNHGLVEGSKMFEIYDHNESKDYEEWLDQRKREVKPTYELLEEQKKTLEEKHEKEIKELRSDMEEMKRFIDTLQKLVEEDEEIIEQHVKEEELSSDFIEKLVKKLRNKKT